MARALAQTQVIVEGGRTNKAFLLTPARSIPTSSPGRYDTGWLDARMATGELLEPGHADVALLERGRRGLRRRARAGPLVVLRRGRAGAGPARPRRSAGASSSATGAARYALRVYQLGPTTYRVATGTSLVDVEVERLGDVERRVTLHGRRHRVRVRRRSGPVHTVEVEGVTHTIARDEGGVVRSPAPAVIVSVAVCAGRRGGGRRPARRAGEHEDGDGRQGRASRAGCRSVLVRPERAGRPPAIRCCSSNPLVTEEESASGDGRRSRLRSGDEPRRTTPSTALRAYLLGYDLDPAAMRR